MNLKYLVFCFEVWNWEFYLPVNPARTNQRGVECIDLVGCHDNLNLRVCIETVKLVQQLQHSSLYLFLAPGV